MKTETTSDIKATKKSSPTKAVTAADLAREYGICAEALATHEAADEEAKRALAKAEAGAKAANASPDAFDALEAAQKAVVRQTIVVDGARERLAKARTALDAEIREGRLNAYAAGIARLEDGRYARDLRDLAEPVVGAVVMLLQLEKRARQMAAEQKQAVAEVFDLGEQLGIPKGEIEQRLLAKRVPVGNALSPDQNPARALPTTLALLGAELAKLAGDKVTADDRHALGILFRAFGQPTAPGDTFAKIALRHGAELAHRESETAAFQRVREEQADADDRRRAAAAKVFGQDGRPAGTASRAAFEAELAKEGAADARDAGDDLDDGQG